MWLCLVGTVFLTAAVPFVVLGWFRERSYRKNEAVVTERVQRRRRWF
jgi:hypothetical protein